MKYNYVLTVPGQPIKTSRNLRIVTYGLIRYIFKQIGETCPPCETEEIIKVVARTLLNQDRFVWPSRPGCYIDRVPIPPRS